MGILEEGNKAIEEMDEGPVLDAALIAGAQKVEHYEIASYGTLAYFAELLGNERAKDLLGETLDEEKAADEKLNQIAESEVNRDALLADSNHEESGMMLGSARSMARDGGRAVRGSRARRPPGRRRASRGKKR